LRFCEDLPISFCSVEATKIGLGWLLSMLHKGILLMLIPNEINIAPNSEVAYTIDYLKKEFEKRESNASNNVII